MFSVPRGLRLAAAALVLSAAFVGCSDNNAPDDEAQVEFKNGTDETIVFAYYSACTDPNWGPDRLGSEEVIDEGDDRVFTLPGAGCWDFRADLSGGNQAELRGVDVDLGERFQWEVTDADIVTARASLSRTKVAGAVGGDKN